MRPLELRLRNFRSFYGEGHSFDFRGRRLIGVVGPIGSGKSTILDAIAFALYGRTPRIGLAVRSLIHQRADNAAVSLLFEVDGEIWESVRNLRREGQSQHALYRLGEDSPLPPDEREKIAVEKISLKGEVDSRVVELLGLDYDAFGRSVLLAQGRFAEFLNARPSERDQVLKGVFGYDRIDAIRELARQAANGGEREIEKLDIRLDVARAAEARLSERRKELAKETARLGKLEAVRPDFDELTGRIEAAEANRTAAETRLAELRNRAGGLPDRAEAERNLERARGVRALLEEAEQELEKASSRSAEAEKATATEEFKEREEKCNKADGWIDRLGDRQRAVEEAAAEAARATAEAEEGERSVEDAGAKLASAEAGLEAAEAAARETDSGLRRAEKLLLDARHADMAGSLREGLAEGDDCPVCEQPVHRVPPVAPGAAAAAEEEAESARSAQQKSQERLRAATGAGQAAKAALEAAEQRLADSRRRVEAARESEAERRALLDRSRTEIEDLLGEGDPAALLGAARAALEALRSEAAGARRDREAKLGRFNKAAADEKQAQSFVSDLETRIRVTAALLGTDTDIPKDDHEAVGSALTALHKEWNRITSGLERTMEEEQAKAEADSDRLAVLRAEHEVEGSIGESLAAVGAACGQIRATIEQDEQLLAGLEDLEAERKDWKRKVRLNSRLVKDLIDSRFIRFLLEEERAALADLGSEHFERLSSGRYRFAEDGKFDVMDLNAAEAVRRADSLSGGETFLASLGLALGLAEMVGRRGGRLDAFFLDEGFGTLDPEHLDLAMEGIESLVSDREQRLVMVVSHVSEVRERIEDLIELDNDSTTGDSRVVSGGSA